MNNTPCQTCPWRKSSTVGGFDIPGFSIELMRKLANTVPQPGEERDAVRPMFACHYSQDGKEQVCKGYVAVVGYTNIAVRIQALYGKLDIAGIQDACEEIDLWPSFEEMLAAYEEQWQS